jgi:hypothetical protein
MEDLNYYGRNLHALRAAFLACPDGYPESVRREIVSHFIRQSVASFDCYLVRTIAGTMDEVGNVTITVTSQAGEQTVFNGVAEIVP